MGYRATPRVPSDTGVGNQTITSTTFVDMASVSFTVRRKQRVIVAVDTSLSGATSTDELDFRLVDEALTVLASGRLVVGTGINSCGAHLLGVQDVVAGAAKTYKLQGKVVTAGQSVSTNTGGFGTGRLTVWAVDS